MYVKSRPWFSVSMQVATAVVLAIAAACAGGDQVQQTPSDTTSDTLPGRQSAGRPPAGHCDTHATLAALPAAGIQTLLESLSQDTAVVREALSGITADSLAARGLTDGAIGIDTTASGQQALVFRSVQHHDCQDLLVTGDTTHYKTRAGIRATWRAGFLTDALYNAVIGFGFNLALVQRLAGDNYDDLRLDQDELCLYIGAGTPEWWAATLPCTGDVVMRSNVPQNRLMRVTRLNYRGNQFEFHDYPDVARWEWDVANRTQAYGIKCGTAWCVIDAGRAPPRIDMTTYGPPHVAQTVIAGWRDEQLLADMTDNNPGNGRPAPMWAVVIPDPDFKRFTLEQLQGMRARAGWAVVRGNFAKYETKFGFRNGRRYELYITRLDSLEVVFNGQVVAKRDVTHNMMNVPTIGAIRWAWNLLDEEQWYPCPLGCCDTRQ